MIYLFGQFELDDENFALTRAGQRLPLEPKALRVLLLLVRSGGRLLTKKAILEAVWKNTFVEESTLSRAITLLRKQLGDDPKRPTFVETVPTLGYRFIAAVRSGDPTPPAQAVAEPIPEGVVAPVRRHRRWLLTMAAVAALCVAGLAAFWVAHRTRPDLNGRKAIVLADFANTTGDPVFDGSLRQGMTVQLDQSPFLALASEQKIQEALRRMGRAADARLTPPLAREVCQRIGSAVALNGSIASLGAQYVLGLRAVNCATGEVLDTEQRQAVKKEDVLAAVSEMAAAFRSRVGESLQSVQSYDTPLAEATTSSLEALEAFSEAGRILSANGSAAALPLFEHAIQLDPQFALAHAMLGRVLGDIGQELRSAESTAQAYRFRDHASERERFFITASYQMQVTGNLQQALETCNTWRQIYPHDAGPNGFPAGVILRVFGRYEEGVLRGRQMVDVDRDFSIPYHLLFLNLFALNRLQDAAELLAEASRRNLRVPFFWLDRYRLDFLQGDVQGMTQLALQAPTQPGAEDLIAGQEAATLAYGGRVNLARERAQRAVATARQSGRSEAAARLEVSSAVRDALLGNAGLAVGEAKAALALSTGRDIAYGAAFALAASHEATTAATLADELERRLPEDTSVHVHYLPAIRALIALDRNEPAAALEALQANAAYELGTPQSAFGGYYGALYPLFVRGQTLLALHREIEAAAEFRKILDHPGIVANDTVGIVARLQLARAYGFAGDRARARAAYAEFIGLWRSADAGSLLWQQANAEYARLN